MRGRSPPSATSRAPTRRQPRASTTTRNAQNYVELEGGGKAAFAALTRGGRYSPYWWEVRLFTPGVIDEVTLRFRPDGTPAGFGHRVAETYVRDESTKALPRDAARALAEARARADWGVDLTSYALVEQSQQTRPTGRVDHAFVYERPERIGEATLRLRLAVAGDELVGVAPFMKVPERFDLRFTELRSDNRVIGDRRGHRCAAALWRGRRRARLAVAVAASLARMAGAARGWRRGQRVDGRRGNRQCAGQLVRRRYHRDRRPRSG